MSALDGHLIVGRDAEGTVGVRLSDLRPLAIAQINGAPAGHDLRASLSVFNLTMEPAPRYAARGDGLRLLWCGPAQYLAVSEHHQDDELALFLYQALEGTDATVVDLSHARTIFRIDGPASRELLAKGCSLDVDRMQPTECVATTLGHFNVLLHCDGKHSFELHVSRSFGLACFQWLAHCAREFGLELPATR